jgi:hypothetical protein
MRHSLSHSRSHSQHPQSPTFGPSGFSPSSPSQRNPNGRRLSTLSSIDAGVDSPLPAQSPFPNSPDDVSQWMRRREWVHPLMRSAVNEVFELDDTSRVLGLSETSEDGASAASAASGAGSGSGSVGSGAGVDLNLRLEIGRRNPMRLTT